MPGKEVREGGSVRLVCAYCSCWMARMAKGPAAAAWLDRFAGEEQELLNGNLNENG